MIIVFGSLNVDYSAQLMRHPRAGETVVGSKLVVAAGGKGGNQALAACRAGSEVRFFGKTGCDANAQIATELLLRDGVNLSGLVKGQTPTGFAMIMVDCAGENVIAIIPGANGELSPEMAKASLADAERGDILLLQQEIPLKSLATSLETACAREVVSILNIAPFIAEAAPLAPKADILIANEHEFTALTNSKPDELFAAMLAWHARNAQTVIVTLGERGVAAVEGGHLFEVPSLSVTPVDTVGAGDTFCGYLAAGLDMGMPFRENLRRAALAGSLACTHAGGQPAIPHFSDVEKNRLELSE